LWQKYLKNNKLINSVPGAVFNENKKAETDFLKSISADRRPGPVLLGTVAGKLLSRSPALQECRRFAG
jgi:hypothetical protein